MPTSEVRIHRGLSLPALMSCDGTEAQREPAQTTARWPSGLECSSQPPMANPALENFGDARTMQRRGAYHAIRFGSCGCRCHAEVQSHFNPRHNVAAMHGRLLGALAATPRHPKRRPGVVDVQRRASRTWPVVYARPGKVIRRQIPGRLTRLAEAGNAIAVLMEKSLCPSR